jgi:hypothetical protein
LPARQWATARSPASFTAITSMPFTCLARMPQGEPFFDRSLDALARSTLVPMTVLGCSPITKITGSFSSAARLKLSKTWPWFDAPSPESR